MSITLKKSIGIVVAIIIIIAAIWYFESLKPSTVIPDGAADIALEQTQSVLKKEAKYPTAKELVAPSGFLNATDELTIQSLIGKKVILVDFWTYSCINCQRTTPYLNSWYDKYRDQGLEIIGVHTPEFEFEKDHANVQRAIERYGIAYPVVQDNDYGTWRAYGNRYWPRKYLIDIDGFIVYDHIGEGAYEETERKIQQLLGERMTRLGEAGSIAQDVTEVNADSLKSRSPEIYFGASRNNYLGQGDAGVVGVQTFTEPSRVRANALYLSGEWDIQSEYARSLSGNAKITFRYQASDVFFVAHSANGAKLRVLVDGEPVPSHLAGSDVQDGIITVTDSDLYKAIETTEYAEHTMELIVEEGEVEVFTFTFG